MGHLVEPTNAASVRFRSHRKGPSPRGTSVMTAQLNQTFLKVVAPVDRKACFMSGPDTGLPASGWVSGGCVHHGGTWTDRVSMS